MCLIKQLENEQIEIQNTDEAAGDASRRFKNKLLAGIHILTY